MSRRAPGHWAGTTIGVVGGRWRGTVTPGGGIVPWDGSARLDWFVASEERWHRPEREASTRQQLLGEVPVVQTSVRVVGGDAVQRVYAVADGGGLTVVEVENRSARSVVVAFTRADVLTTRRPASVPVQGIELPEGSWVQPVAHGATVRIALPHDGRGPGGLPAGLADAAQVAAGWRRQVSGTLRVDLAGGEPSVAVATMRAALLLEGPPDPDDDPVGFLLGAHELVELGQRAPTLVDDVAVAVAHLARSARGAPTVAWDVDAAIEGAGHVAAAAGQEVAVGDAIDVRRRLPQADDVPETPPAGVVGLAWLRRRLAYPARASGEVDLLPAPFPAGWLGCNLEVNGLDVPGGSVSYAVRWHGERPALLWEAVQGAGRLRCSGLEPAWSTERPSGEVLLAGPGITR